MVTIYDVAKEAGCSSATVSKVFNNYKGVSPITYKKVMEASEKLEYTPNNSARALATKKTWLIGVLYFEEEGTGITHPHFSAILHYFQQKAGEYGYDIVFVSKRYGDKDSTYLDHCRYRGVDGVLLAVGAKFTPQIQCVLDSDLKCVSVEMMYPGKYTVISDYTMGSNQALEYLYFLGHRKIAHIGCPLSSLAGKERYNAYKDFLNSKGIEENPKYYVEAREFNPEAGNKALSKLLQNCWDDMPTAIFVAYDDYAFPIMSTLKSQGYRIPEDLSIVGFDNVKMSGYTSPALTTIEQNRKKIGYMAADILVDLMENKEVKFPVENRIDTKLILRNSCKHIE